MFSDDAYHEVVISKGNIISRGRKLYRSRGLRSLIRISLLYLKETCSIVLPNYISYGYYKLLRSWDKFEYQGKTYNYFFHPYCTTWKNERAVAVPIIWNMIKSYESQSKRILEVGNMLSYYFKVNHDIVDKYEIMEGVINEDIIDFKPSKKYDLIVSILTLVEVGWSEVPKEPTKIIRAFENLKNLLSPDGQIVVVMCLGFNPQFDLSLDDNTIKFTKEGYLKKFKGYKWQEAKWVDIKDLKYDESIPTANAIIIGEINQ